MRIGILETGRVNAALAERYGQYPPMMERLFRAAAPEAEFVTVPVVEGVLPEAPEAADAWVITGSRHGVYDPEGWIAPLEAFLRAARGAGRPIVGICFGHQVLAQAFGGRAEKAAAGWGCGVHAYETLVRPGWMADAPATLSFHAMHQDQVTRAPEGTTLLARSAFCPIAMLAYGDPEAPWAISIQPHPEFEAAYARDLIERRSGVIPEPVAAAGIASIGGPVDNAAFARWAISAVGAYRAAAAA